MRVDPLPVKPLDSVVVEDDGMDLLDFLLPIVEHRWQLVLVPLLVGGLAFGAASLFKPTFTARASILPPQQQGSAAAALSQLGALSGLAGLAGGAAGLKSPAEQFVGLMESTTVVDRLIDRFDLMHVYESDYRFEARKKLADNVLITVGKKDGLITIEVDDHDAKRAAALANAHVEELRRLNDRLALTEAKQRRLLFEEQLKQTRDRLTDAQLKLAASGFNEGALKAEPRAAAEGYARLKAEVVAAEVTLQTLRLNLAESTPEVSQQLTTLNALRAQLAALEKSSQSANQTGYVASYREFKYQEALFELLARQYEVARLDESREGALIQMVDTATPPEKKSKPKRALIAAAAAVLTLTLLAAFFIVRHSWRMSATVPGSAEKIGKLRAALHRRRKH